MVVKILFSYFAFNIADPSSRSARVAATVSSTRSTSLGGTNSYQSSRRSSEDSLEEGISLRDVRVSTLCVCVCVCMCMWVRVLACTECFSSWSDVVMQLLYDTYLMIQEL
jgi:hypothetical protein